MKDKIISLALILIALLQFSCSSDPPGNEEAAQPSPVVRVQVAPILKEDLPITLVVDGVTSVRDQQTIVSPIDGTIVSLRAEIGSAIKAGDTLATILTRESEAAIAGARRLLAQAGSAQQRDDALKALQIAEQNQLLVPVVADRHGVVVDKMASAMQRVTANSELLRLVDMSTLDFVANVPVKDLSLLHTGQSARISFPLLSGRSFSGSVASVSASSDRGSQTVPVRLSFEKHSPDPSSLLRVDIMGSAAINVGVHRDALVVPVAALLRNDISNTYTIYTAGADSLARAVAVEVGVVNDTIAEVAAPRLRAGENVIIKGNYEVGDSTRITVEAKDQ
jgi:RND family efflux transporter MFP subunit